MSLGYALEFATVAHAGQVRKYTGEPYVMHCIGVSALVEHFGGDETQRIAALLHDVVEDTPFPIGSVHQRFGREVATIVMQMTDLYTHEAYPDMNRRERKAAERLRWERPHEPACLVKACDLIHNADSIRKHDPDFWVVFKREARLLCPKLVPHLSDEVTEVLHRRIHYWESVID